MKTPITVLQEMMIKLNQVPTYECISQLGPQHLSMFEYRCEVQGVAVTGRAGSKKEAKQEAARIMLQQLHARGLPVPAPFATPPAPRPLSPPSPCKVPALESGSTKPGASAPGAALDARSYVVLLRELCEEYRLGEVTYELVGDSGPPHQRLFTVRAELGKHQRSATATSKKAARQRAAEKLYIYLREYLARLTSDFVEEEALKNATEKSMQRAHERAGGAAEAMARYAELAGARPLLDQRVADYHLGLLANLDPEDPEHGARVLRAMDASAPTPTAELEAACAALSLSAEYTNLGPAVSVVRVTGSTPPLAFAGKSRDDAVRAAVRYVRRTLGQRQPAPAATA